MQVLGLANHLDIVSRTHNRDFDTFASLSKPVTFKSCHYIWFPEVPIQSCIFAYSCRLLANRVKKKLFQKDPECRRGVGQPKTRWNDGVQADLLMLHNEHP